MQRLMKQMQLLTPAQERRLRLTHQSLCVPERVQDALADMAAGSGIRIPLCAPAKLTAMADQSLLSQLTLHLTENAIRYGRPHGHAALSAQGTPDGMAILVRDDGIVMRAGCSARMSNRVRFGGAAAACFAPYIRRLWPHVLTNSSIVSAVRMLPFTGSVAQFAY